MRRLQTSGVAVKEDLADGGAPGLSAPPRELP
jgi:hypothetical protein